MDDTMMRPAPTDRSWIEMESDVRPPPRRVRGLRMPVLPTGSWLAQVGGGVAALSGAYMQFGLGVTMIAGGVAALVLGALREAGKV